MDPKKSPATLADSLTSGRLLARNTVWNLLGQVLPLLVAVFALPILIDKLGTDRFGVLALAWMLIGYFGLFDLGLGRALTNLLARLLADGRGNDAPPLVWTALWLMFLLGVVGALLVALLSPWLATNALRIPVELQQETLQSFYLLAFSLPFVISTAGLRGVLEAYQRFDIANAIRLPMGVITFLGPLLVVPFSISLGLITAVLVGFRIVAWVAHLLSCLYVMPQLRRAFRVRPEIMRSLLHLGGWMTVTNVVGPLMVYLDRFLIGAFLSMAAVTYYVTPYEVVTKLLIIPGALVGVLFPAFSGLASNPAGVAQLYSRATKFIFLALFPVALVIVTLSHEGLALWLSEDFARNSDRVLQLLAVGVLLNSLAQTPFTLIQGAGRPDLTAKLHLFELPFYLLSLWWLLDRFGVTGAAVAWTARAGVDALALFYLTGRLMPAVATSHIRLILPAAASIVLLAFGGTLAGIGLKAMFLLIALTGFSLIAWFGWLSDDERRILARCARLA